MRNEASNYREDMFRTYLGIVLHEILRVCVSTWNKDMHRFSVFPFFAYVYKGWLMGSFGDVL